MPTSLDAPVGEGGANAARCLGSIDQRGAIGRGPLHGRTFQRTGQDLLGGLATVPPTKQFWPSVRKRDFTPEEVGAMVDFGAQPVHWDRSGCARKQRAWPPLPNLVRKAEFGFRCLVTFEGMRIPCFFHAMDVLTWFVVMASLGFMGHAAQGQGLWASWTWMCWCLPEGCCPTERLRTCLWHQETCCFLPFKARRACSHVLVDDEANMTWAEQTPFRGFFMKPWGPGEFVWYNYALRKWIVVDPNFTTLDTLTQTFVADDDYHDVHRFDDGSYLVVLLEEVYMDLTELGGLDNAKVLNPRMLHLDQNETVLREWSGLEHLPIDPALDNLLFSTVDHLHWNAVQFDAHGGLLMSFRNGDQIVRLRPDDWSIHWKLGGPDTEFELTDPGWEGFHVQHDVHDLGNNRILLFDNGIFNANGYLSRALELELDTVNFTATNVWQFAHPSGVYAPAQGSAIRLANGNTLIGWGTAETGEFGTRVTEVTPDGQIALEVRMADGSTMYRARKHPPGTLSGCQEEGAVNPSPSPWVLGPAPCLFDVDEDGDGWTDVEGDCNDDDATTYPGAFETLDDGVDQDCDGMDAVTGCTDVAATNFDPWANVPDGSCLHALSLTVDFASEWVTLGSPNWDPSMPLSRCRSMGLRRIPRWVQAPWLFTCRAVSFGRAGGCIEPSICASGRRGGGHHTRR